MYVIDFETRSRVDLKKCGPYVYATHPSTELLCMGWGLYKPGGNRDLKDINIWLPGKPIPEQLTGKLVVAAHNAVFERLIWKRFLEPEGFPSIPLSRWRCTMAMAYRMAYPGRLELLAEILGLPHQKDKAGGRICQKMARPRKPTKRNRKIWHESTEDWEALLRYCRIDVLCEMDLLDAILPLSEAEQEVWELDQEINDRGIPLDLKAVRLAIEWNERAVAENNRLIQQITCGTVSTSRQRDALLMWLEGEGVSMPDLRASTVASYLASDALTPQVRQVLEARASSRFSSVAKYKAMIDRAPLRRFHGAHIYHRASTGRWAGSGVQIQNLPRGGLKKEEIEVAHRALKTPLFATLFPEVDRTLSSLLRSMITAPPGKRLICLDFNAIEARVMAWVAGEQRMLASFQKGEDIYRQLAGRVFDVSEDLVTKEERLVGKVSILGLQYGMGAARFHSYLEEVAPEAEYTREFAERVVKLYRKTYPAIPRFWRYLDDTILGRHSARQGNPWIRTAIRTIRDRRYLVIQLPSTRVLYYRNPKVRVDRSGEQIVYEGLGLNYKWVNVSTWGGKLAENIVQAIARDLLADAMMRFDMMGHNIVMHVHDEIVVEADGEGAESTLKELKKIMALAPWWADGLPIEVEGFQARRYRKD